MLGSERDRVVGALESRVRDSRDELRSLVQAAADAAGGKRRELRHRGCHSGQLLMGARRRDCHLEGKWATDHGHLRFAQWCLEAFAARVSQGRLWPHSSREDCNARSESSARMLGIQLGCGLGGD